MNHASDTVGVNAAEPIQKKKQRYPRKRKPKPQQEREGGKDDVNASTPLRVDASPFVPSMLKPENTETSSANETSLTFALTPSASRRKRKPLSSTHSLQHLPDEKIVTICPICAADDVEFVAVGHCNHPICTLCAMRLRLKFNEKDCPLCKQQIKLIAVQRCKSTNYDDSNVSSLAEVFLKYGWDQETDCRDLSPQRGLDIDLPTSMVFVDCNSHYRSMSRMRSFLCPFKKCWKGAGGGTFPSEALFLRHIREQHPAKGGGVGSYTRKDSDAQGGEKNEGTSAVGGGPTLCICCLESRPLFTTEHTIFPHPRSLRKHQQADHRECGFCRDFHFDTAAMYKHMSLMHFACPLCPPRLMFRFYRDHVSLHDHLRQAHIVCRACETSATQQLRPNETMDIGAFTFSGPVEYAAHAQEYHGSRVNTAALLRGAVRDGASYQNRNRDNNRRIPHIDLEMGSANPYSASSNDDHSTDLAGISASSFRSTGLSSSVRDPRARGSSSSSSSNAGMGSRNNPLSFISPNMQIVGRVTGSGRFSGRLTDSDLELQAAADRQAAAVVAQVRQMNMQHESVGTSGGRGGGERANGGGERNGACAQARLEAQFPSLTTSNSTPSIAPSYASDSYSSGAVAVESSSSAWGSSGGSATTASASPALHPLSVMRNRAQSSSTAPSDGGSVSVHGSRMQRSAMLADAFFGSAGAPVGDLGIACRGAGAREATSAAAMTHSSGSGNAASSARAAVSSSVAEEFELALWVLSTTAMITPPSAPLNSRAAAVSAATLIDPSPPSRFSCATFPRVRFIKTMLGIMVDDLPLVELRGVAHLFHRFLYPPTLVQWAKQNKTEILKIEKKVYDLLNDATRSSVNLKPMASSTRSLTHFLAKMYLLNSHEYDPEPRRYVSFVKTHASGSPSMLFSKELTIARPNSIQNHIASATSITTSTVGGASGVQGIAGTAGSESSSSVSGSIHGGGMREYVLSVRMNGVSLQIRSANKLQAISVLNQQSTNNRSNSTIAAWGLGGIGGGAGRGRSGSAEASSMDVDADLLNYRHCAGIFSIADVVGKVVAYLLQDPFYQQQQQQQQLLSEAQANPLKLQGVRLTSPSAVSFVFTDHVAATRAVTVLKQLQACVPPSPSSSLTAQLSSDGYLLVPTESLSPIAAAVLGERVATGSGGAAAGAGRSPQQGMILSHAEVTFLQCVEFLPLFDPPSALTQQTQQPQGLREGEVGGSGEGGVWESDWHEGRRGAISRDMDGGGFSIPGHGTAFFAPTAGVARAAGAAGIGMGAGGADAWWTEDEVEGGNAGGSAVAVHDAEIWAGGGPADEEGSAPVASAFASYAMSSHHEGASGSDTRGAIPGNAADTNADADAEADVSISRDRVPGGAALASLSAAQEEWEQFLQERSQMIATALYPAAAAAGVVAAAQAESAVDSSSDCSQSAASLPLPAQSTDPSISAPATHATTTAAAANRSAPYLPPWRRNLNSGSEEGRTMRREMGVGVATGAGEVQRLEVALDPTPVAVPIAVPYTVENSFDDDLVAYITHQHSAADTPPPPLALTSEATGARGAGGQQQGARNRQRGQLDAVRGVRGAAAGDGTWAGGPANPFTLLQGSRGDDSSDEEVGNVHEEDEEVVVAVEEEEHEAAGEAEAAVEL